MIDNMRILNKIIEITNLIKYIKRKNCSVDLQIKFVEELKNIFLWYEIDLKNILGGVDF
jgi:hypothetical protein